MKLLRKYSRINVTANIVIFLLSSIVLYFSLRFILIGQIDDDLRIEEREIQIHAAKHGRIPESISVDDQLIEFSAAPGPGARSFHSIRLQSPGEAEQESFRQLRFFIRDDAGWHRVEVSKSLEQTDYLTRSLFTIAVVTTLMILLVSALINRWAMRRIWRPFHQALGAAREHKLSEDAPLALPDTSIEEFKLLNESLQSFARHARLEYLSLKTFSENATHELQTPIAVIRSKLDLLMQEHSLSEPGAQALQAAFNSLERLGRLNQSLLLLARIENQQFSDREDIGLHLSIREKVDEFQELFDQKELQLHLHLEPVLISMNRALVHVLLNNLLSNAVRYCPKGGTVEIRLTAGGLSIGNSADAGALAEGSLFHRFQRQEPEGGHSGLGLALVREICMATGFTTSYRFVNDMHWFCLQFIPV